MPAKTKKSKTTKKREQKATSIDPQKVFDIYMTGYNVGRKWSSILSDPSNPDLASELEPQPAQATNCDGPKLRLVTDGFSWGVEGEIEEWKRTEIDEEPDGLYEHQGWFIKRIYRRVEHKIESKWVGLRNGFIPGREDLLTFPSRETAIKWVRREYGEAGVRSLQKNAEFRPA